MQLKITAKYKRSTSVLVFGQAMVGVNTGMNILEKMNRRVCVCVLPGWFLQWREGR